MKVDRLFSIVNILINKKSVTSKELAEKFNVSLRTIYRDIDTLSENGIPVFSRQGKGGGISIMDGYTVDKTLFSEDEQKQVLMALDSVNAVKKIDVNDSYEKLSNIFKKKDTSWIQIDFSPWQYNENDRFIFDLLKECILDNREVSFEYFNSEGNYSKRYVQPYKLVFKSNYWYLYGFCLKRNDMRFFKLNRINSLKVSEKTFIKREIKIESSYDYLEKCKVLDVELLIDKSMGYRVYDEFKAGHIEHKDNNFRVLVKLPNDEYIINYLLSFGNKLKILKPESLKEKYKIEIEKIMKKYKT